jgi:hypothetical protein
MITKRNILTALFLAFASFAFAQTGGKVIVVKDPLIDSIIARRIALNKTITPNGSSIVVYGYRVQVFFGADRKEAYDQQAKFKDLYPELNTYVSYTQPNYKVRAGDFRTRAEAQKLLNDLRSVFPTLFIFSERINPIKADELNADR